MALKGKDAPNWKDNPNYRTLHRWVNHNKPRVDHCEECGATDVVLECSCNNHNYTRNFDDYRWLCRKCHMRVDDRIRLLKQGPEAIARVEREIAEGIRTCIYCGVTKPIAEFSLNKYNAHGIQAYCRECGKLRCLEHYRRTHPGCKPRGEKTSRFPYVYRCPSKTSPWRSSTTINGKTVNFGSYKTEEEAYAAFVSATGRSGDLQ